VHLPTEIFTTCPLIVVAGQQQILPGDGDSPAFGQWPLCPQKRTLELSRGMSALCQKRAFAAQQKNANSISSSPHAWSVAGRAIPWAFVVFRLATISKVVGRALNSGSVVGASKI
jgi:hypothetical protein